MGTSWIGRRAGAGGVVRGMSLGVLVLLAACTETTLPEATRGGLGGSWLIRSEPDTARIRDGLRCVSGRGNVTVAADGMAAGRGMTDNGLAYQVQGRALSPNEVQWSAYIGGRRASTGRGTLRGDVIAGRYTSSDGCNGTWRAERKPARALRRATFATPAGCRMARDEDRRACNYVSAAGAPRRIGIAENFIPVEEAVAIAALVDVDRRRPKRLERALLLAMEDYAIASAEEDPTIRVRRAERSERPLAQTPVGADACIDFDLAMDASGPNGTLRIDYLGVRCARRLADGRVRMDLIDIMEAHPPSAPVSASFESDARRILATYRLP